MRTPRVYCPIDMSGMSTIELDERASHYLLNALRAKTGYALVLFNGDGKDFHASIVACNRKGVRVTIGEEQAVSPPSPLRTTLAIALSKGERLDLAIQKATELGVDNIQLLRTRYTAVKLASSRVDKKMTHWRAVAISACEQCGRSTIPTIETPIALDNWLPSIKAEIKIALHPDGPSLAATLADHAAKPRNACLLTGPEGGLSAEEIQLATQHGFNIAGIGPRVLRAETAPLAGLALLQAKWGDWS